MEKKNNKPAEPTWGTDAELSDDELDGVNGGAITLGGVKITPGNIGLGGPDTKSGNSGPAINNPVAGSGGFSGPAPQRPR